MAIARDATLASRRPCGSGAPDRRSCFSQQRDQDVQMLLHRVAEILARLFTNAAPDRRRGNRLVGVRSVPQFSPDGEDLLFTVSGGKTGVHVVDVASVIEGVDPGPTMVHGIVAAYNATWSPNGDWIAFTRETSTRDAYDGSGMFVGDAPTNTTLWVVRRDGSGGRQLSTADDGEVYEAPTWSPDSTAIAFATAGRNGSDLWTVGIDDIAPTRIYRAGISLWNAIVGPAWSPDGKLIAFSVDAESPDEAGLMLILPDGSDALHVSNQSLIPTWQPIPAD